MALANIFGWNKKDEKAEKKTAAVCGTACGAADKSEESSAEGSTACGTACGASDK